MLTYDEKVIWNGLPDDLSVADEKALEVVLRQVFNIAHWDGAAVSAARTIAIHHKCVVRDARGRIVKSLTAPHRQTEAELNDERRKWDRERFEREIALRDAEWDRQRQPHLDEIHGLIDRRVGPKLASIDARVGELLAAVDAIGRRLDELDGSGGVVVARSIELRRP